ncbi:hypothetical protein D9M71_457420 [compost metagenome]
MPVRVDRRESPQKLAEHRHYVQATEYRPHADLQCTRWLPTGAGEVGHGILDGVQAGADFAEKQLAGLGQRQAARAALKQSDAQARLKLGNALAHRRRRQAQASRRFGEAADLGAAHKAFDTAEGFHRRHYKLLVYTDYRNYGLHST